MEQNVLYESRGISEKQTNLIQFLAVLLLICGSAAFIMSDGYYGQTRNVYIGVGILVLGAGLLLLCAPTLFMQKYENVFLVIYEDRVEGRGYKPDEEFTLKFEEIYDVKKTTTVGWNILVIESADCCYWVTVQDPDLPYRIINKKLDELEKVN